MNEQGLHGIAGSWVVSLGVHHNLDRLHKKASDTASSIKNIPSPDQHTGPSKCGRFRRHVQGLESTWNAP